ncbi:Type II secretory pathway, pseudopilin PulG [Duganella sp. CF517]|uniref:type II secretion system protein n=1 Tax=Duganella sp. CF517 TaxID=1881038 RepID=UPI0008C59D61|nr:type II secretion system protein [Duganella sp. CF517]SEN47392.1 Type II secretory pathway, pseudopilin PulG [Duganella sp. CF517]
MRRPRKGRDGGFTYLSLIILVAIIGLVSASALKLGSVLQRSRAEQELLDIGAAFSDALQSYADATPAGFPPQPPSLKELLKDPRFPTVRRHLRKVFVDPMTGKAEWGITYLGDKVGVLAVYSLSDAKPVRIGNFPQRFQGLAGKQKISEWRFAATGGRLPAPGQNQQTGAVEVKPGTPLPGGPATPIAPAPPAPLAPLAPPEQTPVLEPAPPPEEEKPAPEPEPQPNQPEPPEPTKPR